MNSYSEYNCDYRVEEVQTFNLGHRGKTTNIFNSQHYIWKVGWR